MRHLRSGFTIAEVLVALLLGAVVLGLAWSFFTPESRRFRSDQSRLAGLQGILQLDEALAWDVERIALALPDAQPAFTLDVPVVITEGRRLELRTFAPDSPAAIRLGSMPVVYEHDPATGTVSRAAGGRTRIFPGLIARDLQFSLVRLDPPDPAPGQPGGGFGAGLPLHAVKYIVTCYSEELRDTAEALRRDHELVTLAGAVALTFRSDRIHHPYWRAGVTELLERGP